MLKIYFADYPGLSVVILVQFAITVCVATQNRKKNQIKISISVFKN